MAKLFAEDPAMGNDPRFNIYSDWLRLNATGQRSGRRSGAAAPAAPAPGGGAGIESARVVIDAMHAGANIVAGTDSPNAFALHGEMETYVMAGMTPYQALRAATVTPAGELNLDAGSIEAGKLADIVIVDGNPLEDIANAHKVKQVIANGRLYSVEDLISGNIHSDLAH
jgi:imidazolonepropionase-like amidohydrolase